jgi:hypothetical protein
MAGKRAQELQKQINALPPGAAKTAAQAAYNQAMVPTGKGTGKISKDELKNITDVVAGGGGQTPVLQQQGLTAEQTDWIAYLEGYMANIGLPTLVPKMREYIEMDYTPDTVILKIQETPEYRERFSGNISRQKAGLPVLSPSEYLDLESSYRQVFRASDLPVGFYDQPDDFAAFIGNDISPAELKQRVDIANQFVDSADPLVASQLQSLYGVTKGSMVANVLDAQRALPLINKQVQAAQFGAEAARQGLQVGRTMAETYTQTFGVTQDQARQGFEQIAMIQPEAARLSSIFERQTPAVGMEETVSAVFGGESSADYKKRLQRLSEMEQSLFAGQSGVGAGSLAQGRAGQF